MSIIQLKLLQTFLFLQGQNALFLLYFKSLKHLEIMYNDNDNFFGFESFVTGNLEIPEKQEMQPQIAYQNNFVQKQRQPSPEDVMKTPKSKFSSKLSSQSNPEDLSPSKTPKLKPKKSKLFSSEKQKNPNQLSGHWGLSENKRYHWFLEIYYSPFLNRCMRRMDKIFTSMSKFVGTREAQQCRSHHQKMQKKHKAFTKILLSLRKTHYDSYDERIMKADMEENKIVIQQDLLTEDFLTEHRNQSESGMSQQKEKQEKKVESPVQSPFMQAQQSEEEKQEQQLIVEQKDLGIEDIFPFELESSKNDCFRFLSFIPERTNIMDDEYENKLTFDPFF